MTTAALVFPHQLYAEHPAIEALDDGGDSGGRVVMVEDTLYFGDPSYPMRFHKQRLSLHRASMQHYRRRLERAGFAVTYVEYENERRTLHRLFERLRGEGVRRLVWTDPTDFILHKRVTDYAADLGLALDTLDNPDFINTRALNEDYAANRKRWFMADFYKWQRRRLGVMMDGDEPQGGQWSFDHDNRKKVPKSMLDDLPRLEPLNAGPVEQEARDYVERRFPENYGSLQTLWYPTTHDDASRHLDVFLAQRLDLFGDYEDAIVRGEHWLWHGVLTPMLNTGLLTPREVVNRTLAVARENGTRLNSLEGFVRQVIGWREFMRASYEALGVRMRHGNHWRHHRRLPEAFWTGDTGIAPVDDVITRVADTGYAHHIERLMVMGGFLFLIEAHPDDVYRWFMEMFVDAYDWVMVPNTYAMSQHADGGLITTKPYFSGSNYIRKQSNFSGRDTTGEDWEAVWDGLYWRFIHLHRDELAKNPRWATMCRTAERMDEAKMKRHLANADAYLAKLDAMDARAAA